MRAIRLHEFGPAENLVLDELPDLDPAPDQVRIAVHASGVHLLDTTLRRGEPGPMPLPELPTVPGREVAGVVDLVGPASTPPGSAAGWSRTSAWSRAGTPSRPSPRWTSCSRSRTTCRLPRRDRRRRDRSHRPRRPRARAAGRRRRRAGALGRRRPRLAAGPGRAARRSHGWSPRPAARAHRAAGGAEARPGRRLLARRLGRARPGGDRRRHPGLRRRRRRRRARVPRAAATRRAARDVRLLGRYADPVRHRRRHVARHHRRLEPRPADDALPGGIPGLAARSLERLAAGSGLRW